MTARRVSHFSPDYAYLITASLDRKLRADATAIEVEIAVRDMCPASKFTPGFLRAAVARAQKHMAIQYRLYRTFGC